MRIQLRHPRRLHRSGFTLVEILMVVIILGIASAVVVPNLGTHNDLNVAAGARVVMADLVYAQNKAIVTQGMVYVNFDRTNQQYTLYSASPSTTPAAYLTNPLTNTNYVTKFGATGPAQTRTVWLRAITVDTKPCLAFD